MNEWYFLFTPLAVLVVLFLFRFVGCESFGTAENAEPATTTIPGPPPEVVPDYPKTVMDEKDGAGNPVLVSYWRLQEPPPPSTTPPTPFPPAKDEKNVNNGTYKQPSPALTDRPADLSPAAAPNTLDLGKTGLLEFQNSTSMEVQGGYVEVPFSPTLNLASFTLEALVYPMWDPTISNLKRGRFRCVVEFGGPPKKKSGYGLYAGPPDPSDPTKGIYQWQVGIGTGSEFILFPGPAVQFNQTNYLAVTFDGVSKELVIFIYHRGIDLEKSKQLHKQTPAGGPINYLPNTATVPFLIGRGRSLLTNYSGLLYPFHGRIQEVALYRIALREERLSARVFASLKNL